MKFKVVMKDPDTLHDAIADAVKAQVNGMDNIDADERESLIEQRREKVADICDQWFTYGEYLIVEIDTDAQTATVLKERP